MPETQTAPQPALFTAAVESIRTAMMRPELTITEIPAPGTLAPWSFALAADVASTGHRSSFDLGTGRFVLLYDPSAPEAWDGVFRIICYAQAPLETELGVDPFLADVTWSWLIDALANRDAQHTAASGTATRILSTGFGELEAQGDGAQIELRASWTPTSEDLAAHAQSWGDVICMLAGLPPLIDGVNLISAHRVRRD